MVHPHEVIDLTGPSQPEEEEGAGAGPSGDSTGWLRRVVLQRLGTACDARHRSAVAAASDVELELVYNGVIGVDYLHQLREHERNEATKRRLAAEDVAARDESSHQLALRLQAEFDKLEAEEFAQWKAEEEEHEEEMAQLREAFARMADDDPTWRERHGGARAICSGD
jgi:hypothetical protein